MNLPNLPDVPDGTEQAELSAAKKELRSSIAALVIVSVLLLSAVVSWLVLNFAWFTNVSQASGEGMSMDAQKLSSTSYTLEHLVGNSWEDVTDVRIENFLPGQSEIYKLTVANASTSDVDATVQLKEFSVYSLKEGDVGSFRLADKIRLAVNTSNSDNFLDSITFPDVSLTPAMTDVQYTGTTLDGDGRLCAASIVTLATVPVTGSGSYALTFRLTLDEKTSTDPDDMTDGKYTDYMNKGLAAAQIALSAVVS